MPKMLVDIFFDVSRVDILHPSLYYHCRLGFFYKSAKTLIAVINLGQVVKNLPIIFSVLLKFEQFPSKNTFRNNN